MYKPREKILITGANGYIGKHLVSMALRADYDINALVRNPGSFNGNKRVKLFQYDFSLLPKSACFEGVSTVLHLAATTGSLRSESDDVEVEAARRLIDCVRNSGVKRIIFISSQTADSNAPTVYGRTKWAIEQEIFAANGLIVRPGQVYGGREKGLFGLLVATVRRFPVLPGFVPAPMIQPIHVDDLAQGLLRMVEKKELASGVYCLASETPISFSAFLSLIAKYRVRSYRLFLPVPVFFVSLAATVLGGALSGKLGLDRLKSLFNLQPMNTATDLERLNLTLRPVHAGMHPSGDDRRRRLLIEGTALFKYILKKKQATFLLRRYVRAIEQVRDGSPVEIPGLFLSFPVLLSLLDDQCWKSKPKGKELAWRFDAATLLAEATPEGASVFLGTGRKTGLLINLLVVVQAVVSDLFWRIVKVLSYPFIMRIICRKRVIK